MSPFLGLLPSKGSQPLFQLGVSGELLWNLFSRALLILPALKPPKTPEQTLLTSQWSLSHCLFTSGGFCGSCGSCWEPKLTTVISNISGQSYCLCAWQWIWAHMAMPACARQVSGRFLMWGSAILMLWAVRAAGDEQGCCPCLARIFSMWVALAKWTLLGCSVCPAGPDPCINKFKSL